MKEDILEKLSKLLSNPVTSEPEVIYVLCQIRKLLDKYPIPGVLTSLKFYCHWALHIDLKHSNWVLPFLKPLDEYTVSYHYRKHPYSPGEDFQKLEHLLVLNSFRSQLKKALKAYGLPHKLCTDPGRWTPFVQAYANVVNDGELLYSGSGLQLIEKVSFEAFRIDLPKHVRVVEGGMTINWIVTLKNDQGTLDFSLYFADSGAHSIYIHPNGSKNELRIVRYLRRPRKPVRNAPALS